MKKLDVRGLSCPEPVLMVSNALHDGENDSFKVLASEAHTVANIKEFVEGKGKKVSVRKVGDDFEMEIS
ncbi:MAG: sulfurtransferase TusA family protein [Clostridiaceae bacterium]